MVREIDVRTITDRQDLERQAVLADAAAGLSLSDGGTVEVASFDGETGNPAVIVSRGGESQRGDYVARSLAHLQSIKGVVGLEAAQPPEYIVDPHPQTTSAGAVAVHLRQAYKGIPIYDMAETVRFDPDGRLLEVAGRSFTVAADVPVTPARSAEEALRTAADLVGSPDDEGDARTDPFGEPLVEPTLDLSGFDPVVRSVGADRADQVTSFDAPPFPHAVTAALMWFPLADGLRLSWHMRLQVPGGSVYRVLVDASDGRVLLCRRLTHSIVGRADLVLTAGEARRPANLPLPLETYGIPMPNDDPPQGLPIDWLVDDSTKGACVRAVLADGMSPVQGRTQGGAVVFPAAAPEHLVVNLFALCSAMHDALYLLGFREEDGNFQLENFGRGGRQSDPVLAIVHPGPVTGTANMSTPADGRQPTMNMGLVSSTGRHTALDPDVVYHEYAHGLSNRLVGGGINDAALEEVQSRGMGEGWSDFFACTMQEKEVVGDWVVDRSRGIRQSRYDEQFPHTYADLGTGRFVGQNFHDLGEVWAATLMALSRRLGRWPTAQLVLDALKQTSPNPSFLAARDAIILTAGQTAAAAGMNEAASADFVQTVWDVFARFGMGPKARTNVATLSGIVADFEPPPG